MKPSETIFDGKTYVIPMADVSHIEKDQREMYKGSIRVITKHTTWNGELDGYNNLINLCPPESEEFLRAWCRFRSEIDDSQTGPEDEKS
ncbi:MAG TPA: hypothetical protein VMV78_14540 [Thiobacillus sp.]|nr:hypothetical protein [Thiobacillus sp.]